MLSVVMLNVVILNVVMLNVVMLNVVMLSVVAAERPARDKYSNLLQKLVNYRSKESCNIGPKSLRL